jgi:hypothetical protein
MHIPEHWMEIPTWIPRIQGMLQEPARPMVFDNVNIAAYFITQNEWDEFVFSAMDTNKHLIKHLAQRASHKRIWVGGYVDKDYFKGTGVHWVELDELPYYFEVNLDYKPFYDDLFKQEYSTLRLFLSDGCLYNCSFCTIPKELTLYNEMEIKLQIDAFKGLKFKHVYVNDKTFGQAENYSSLGWWKDVIKGYNPEFEGFIVQTTANMAIQKWDEFIDMGVKFIEVGVEFPDDRYLRKFRKPHNMAHIRTLTEFFRTTKDTPGFIPNLIFGIPGVDFFDYANLAMWVKNNLDIISFVNPFILSTYHDAKGDVGGDYNTIDSNENSMQRSWLSEEDQALATMAMDNILKLTGG